MKILKRKYASPHFLWKELECKCGKRCDEEGVGQSRYVQPQMLEKLEAMRKLLGPLRLSSVCRCPVHNAAIGGAPLSRHRSLPPSLGKPTEAADVILDYPKAEIIAAAEEVGFGGIGINYRTFVHCDNRPRRVRF